MKLFKINIRDISECEYQQAAEDFPDVAYRLKNAPTDSIKSTLAGRILLKGAIKQIYGKESFDIFYNENGKPFCDFCFFSISHSADLVVCAVSEKNVGVDAELIDKFKKREKYMLFSKRESGFINEENSAERFYTLWTMKEAFVKANGGKLSDAAKTELVSPELKLVSEYGGFKFNTEKYNNYIVTSAELFHFKNKFFPFNQNAPLL